MELTNANTKLRGSSGNCTSPKPMNIDIQNMKCMHVTLIVYVNNEFDVSRIHNNNLMPKGPNARTLFKKILLVISHYIHSWFHASKS